MKLKYYILPIVFVLIGLGIFIAYNYTPTIETYEAKIVIDDRDEEQKIADQLAAFARQLKEARLLRAEFTIQKEDTERVLLTIKRELKETLELEEDIKGSILSLADNMVALPTSE